MPITTDTGRERAYGRQNSVHQSSPIEAELATLPLSSTSITGDKLIGRNAVYVHHFLRVDVSGVCFKDDVDPHRPARDGVRPNKFYAVIDPRLLKS